MGDRQRFTLIIINVLSILFNYCNDGNDIKVTQHDDEEKELVKVSFAFTGKSMDDTIVKLVNTSHDMSNSMISRDKNKNKNNFGTDLMALTNLI